MNPQAELENLVPLNAEGSDRPSFVNQQEVDSVLDSWLQGKETAGGITALPEKPSHPLTHALLEPVIRLPFAFAAQGYDYDDFELQDKEAKDLTDVWLSALQRLLPASQSIDVIIAATCTMGIVGFKWVCYRKAKKEERQFRLESEKARQVKEPDGSKPDARAN